MLKNANQGFFQDVYPSRWLSSKALRDANASHYAYQEITLDSLDCFDGCTMLECGCASGELLDRLRDRYSNVLQVGVDLGKESLSSADRSANRGHKPAFVEGDIATLPLESNRFDRVLCSSVLWYLPDPMAAVREMIRVLKPGGRFVFDVRNPYHITNLLTKLSLGARRLAGKPVPSYAYTSPREISRALSSLPVRFDVAGYFVLLPTRLPMFRDRWGDWTSLSPRLAYSSGRGWSKWLAQKLLVTGEKLNDAEPGILASEDTQ